jgi:hypothetical protein
VKVLAGAVRTNFEGEMNERWREEVLEVDDEVWVHAKAGDGEGSEVRGERREHGAKLWSDPGE